MRRSGYGFMKRHAHEDPALQRELNRGLGFAIEDRRRHERRDRALKAMSLCLWAGADPWADLHEPWDSPEEDEEADDVASPWWVFTTPAGMVVSDGDVEALRVLRLKAGSPRFQALYALVESPEMFDALMRIEPLVDPHPLVDNVIRRSVDGARARLWSAEAMLRHVLEGSGKRLERLGDWAVRLARRGLATEHRGYDGSARRLVALLRSRALVAEEVLVQVVATPTLLERHRELGLTRADLELVAGSAQIAKSAAAAARRALRNRRRRSR